MANEGNVILEVKNLKKYFKVGNKDILKAVDNVSFAIKEGETLGLVGESGCGKTTCGRTVIGMYDKTDGEVLYKGKPVHGLKGKAKRDFTKEVQIIFQDPYASLNPRMTVADIIAEGIDIHGLAKDKEDRTRRVYELLDQVGLNREHANRFVHEFSGGQRQRIMLEGDVPSPINTPPGCKFQGRCSKCMDICKKEAPLFKEVEKGHFVACHLYE